MDPLSGAGPDVESRRRGLPESPVSSSAEGTVIVALGSM